MATLTILEYPNPRLRIVAEPVAVVDDKIRTLIDNMFETMVAADGIGLAATQVDVHQRIIVIDISDDKKDLLVLINPKLIKFDGQQEYEEGCLSVPGFFETVKRYENITISYQDLKGNLHTVDADGLLSVCIQHEMDHLVGKVFVEYLSQLKQQRIKKKISKLSRAN